MAYAVMAYIVMACIAMAFMAMAYTAMAHTVMAYIATAYVASGCECACVRSSASACACVRVRAIRRGHMGLRHAAIIDTGLIHMRPVCVHLCRFLRNIDAPCVISSALPHSLLSSQYRNVSTHAHARVSTCAHECACMCKCMCI